MNSKDTSDDAIVEQLLDALLDAADADRDSLLLEFDASYPKHSVRLRRLLSHALDTQHSINNTVDRVAPDLFGALVNEDDDRRIGERLGPYRLTERIGRGGMGVVYLAERCDGAYEQAVAVKFMPKFVSSEASRAMFEQERAHLARLEHPNIARIIDAGVASDQSPYFIMEYVDGERIDRAVRDLPLDERLSLFLQLCDAVAYCHRSLVVHGDIKPGNVMVADGRTRLLDFGIGRLLSEQQVSPEVEGVRAFSPDFGAPEQRAGELPGVQSDVYSLGALLHLLVEECETVDLKAIIEKCLQFEPSSRYRSIDLLQRDIVATLDHYPVSARQQTRAYRTRKFIRRNRLLVASTAIVILGLGTGLSIATWQYSVAKTEALRSHQVASFVKSLFERAGPYNSGEGDVTLLQLMEDARQRLPTELPDAPDVRTEVEQLIASGYYGIGDYDTSFEIRQNALAYWQMHRDAPHLTIVGALNDLGDEHTARGEYDAAAALHREAIEQLRQLDMESSLESWHSWTRLGTSLSRKDPQGSLDVMQRAHEINLKLRPSDDSALARSLANIAFGLRATGDHAAAAEISEQAIALADANGERLATDIIDTRCNLALDYSRLGLGDKARSALRECIALGKERLGPDHPDLVAKYNNLGAMELSVGRLREAEVPLEEAVALATRVLPETSLYRIAAEINYSILLLQSGRSSLAEPLARRALLSMEKTLGASHAAAGRARTVLARIVLATGDPEQSLGLLETSLDSLSGVWRADALLWMAEAKLAVDARDEAAGFARESLAMREQTEGTAEWQIAEASWVLANATFDGSLRDASASRLDVLLPAEHLRRRQLSVAE